MLERPINALEVAQFVPPDLEACMSVWEEAVAGAYVFLSGEAIRHQRQVEVRMADVDTYVARVAGKIVGFASCSGVNLLGLFVSPAYQRQGVGQKLVERIARPGKELNVVVYQENASACAFYRRLGFNVIRVRYLDGDGFRYPVFEMRQNTADV